MANFCSLLGVILFEYRHKWYIRRSYISVVESMVYLSPLFLCIVSCNQIHADNSKTKNYRKKEIKIEIQ